MEWIYRIPMWLFELGVIAIMCGASAGGLIVVHRRRGDQEFTHNDVAGPIITTVGTVLAVMLSFMVVVVWQEFDASAANVQREASAVADLYQLAPLFSPKITRALRSNLHDYAQTVVQVEWHLMQFGERSNRARALSLATLEIVARYHPNTPPEIALQTEAFDLVRTFTDERRSRIFDNQQSIPLELWLTMSFIGGVTIVSSYFFQVRNFKAHLLMVVALAAVIGSIFVIIVEFDLPFRGDISVPPTAFVNALDAMAQTPAMK